MSSPRILGIDPGIAGTGIAVIELGRRVRLVEMGSVRTLPSGRKAKLRQADDDASRLRIILAAIVRAIDDHGPCVVAYETPLGSKGVRAAKSLAYVIGGVVTLAAERELAVMSVTPGEAKAEATGAKTASKAEIEAALCDRLDLPSDLVPVAKVDREHAFDALAVALVASRSELVRAMLTFAAQGGRPPMRLVGDDE